MSEHLSEDIERAVETIESDAKETLLLAGRLVQAGNGAVYRYDLFANAVLKRTLALSSGFCTMIRQENFICAGALVRLHLDTVLRVFAGISVENPGEFAVNVLFGKRIDQMKDRNDKRMTDRYLVDQLSKIYPWMPEVYRGASGYVHMSDKHILSTLRMIDRDEGIIEMNITSTDSSIPDSIYLEAIGYFRACTRILQGWLADWVTAKQASI